jgi:hypothetical protein
MKTPFHKLYAKYLKSKKHLKSFLFFFSLLLTHTAHAQCDFLKDGMALEKQGKYQEAIRKYILAVKDCGKDAATAMNKINTLVNRIEKAEREAKSETEKARKALQRAEISEREAKDNFEKAMMEQSKNQNIYFYAGKFALAYRNNKYGFIDKEGKEIIPCQYDLAGYFDDSGYAKVRKEGKDFLLDTAKNEYKVAYNITEIDKETTALDLRGQKLDSLPASIFTNTQLKMFVLDNDFTINKLLLPSNNDNYQIYCKKMKLQFNNGKLIIFLTSSSDKYLSISTFYKKKSTTDLDDDDWVKDEDITKEQVKTRKTKNKGKQVQDTDTLRLSFISNFAIYDISNYTLNLRGVPFIRSVDAEIIPDSSLVTIRYGEIDILENARVRIMVDKDTAHTFYNANIKIKSSREYEGNGVYYYINDIMQTYKIKFTEFLFNKKDAINPKDKNFTYVEAYISEDDNFEVQGGKLFKGTVKMYATRKELVFDGYTRNADDPNGFWVRTNAGNKVITYTGKEKSEDKQDLETGIFLSKNLDEGSGMYSLVNKPIESKGDKPLLLPEEGSTVKLDVKTKKYVIAPSNRQEVAGEKQPENYMGKKFAYSNASGEVDFEGEIDIFEHNRENFTVTTSCIGKGNFKTNIYSMNTMLTLDLGSLAGDAFREMASNILSQVDADETPIKVDDELLYKLGAQISQYEMKSYIRRVERGKGELSKVLDKKALVISEVNMKWNKEYKAFYSTGKLQLSNIYNKNISQLIDGYIEIPMDGGGKDKAMINIYLEISPKRWYYISYRNNKIYLQSSNAKFNDIAAPKKKLSKDGYKLLEKGSKSGFVSRFRRAYLGLDTPVEVQEED